MLTLTIIGILTISTFWRLASFENNLQELSFSINTSGQNLNISEKLKGIINQTENQAEPTYKNFKTASESLSFSYPDSWQEASANLLAQEEKPLFCATKIDISTISADYLIVNKFLQTDNSKAIEKLKNQFGKNANATFERDESYAPGKNEILRAYNATYNIAPVQSAAVTLNGRVALISLPDKIYAVGIYGAPENWENFAAEADKIFSTVKIETENKNILESSDPENKTSQNPQ